MRTMGPSPFDLRIAETCPDEYAELRKANVETAPKRSP